MSIKIHHGPPGSYKTSGSVMDDFIPAALLGRTIITNVRGLNNPDNVRAALNRSKTFYRFKARVVPDTFELIFVDTTVQEGRDKLATFFHWAPHGAFLLVDEAQTIWPLIWKDADLKKLDYPGGLVLATRDNRPSNFLTAFEMHRHYGWDMVLTTPNISKIRSDIRGTCEGAYKHKNQALIGLNGYYLEAFHLAEDTGKSVSDFLSLRNRKIKKEVWKLYASTATGTHSDTIAGTPIWKNPRVYGFLVFLAAIIVFIINRPTPAVIAGVRNQAAKVADKEKVSSTVRSVGSGNVANSQNVEAILNVAKTVQLEGYLEKYLTEYRPRLVALIESKQKNRIVAQVAFLDSNNRVFEQLNIPQIVAFGFVVERKPYGLLLKRNGNSYPVTAWPLDKNKSVDHFGVN